MPVTGRKINLITDVLRLAERSLQETFFVSPQPDENICFTGQCSLYCDQLHPICGKGHTIEGSFTAFYPMFDGSDVIVSSLAFFFWFGSCAPPRWMRENDICVASPTGQTTSVVEKLFGKGSRSSGMGDESELLLYCARDEQSQRYPIVRNDWYGDIWFYDRKHRPTSLRPVQVSACIHGIGNEMVE